MRTLGICFGATTIQSVELRFVGGVPSIVRCSRLPHEGNPALALERFLATGAQEEFDHVAVTGRSFRHNVALTSLSEPEAVEWAIRHAYSAKETPELCISIGGETLLIYRLGTGGMVTSVHTGNKCASGTGEFFVQQVQRMGLSVDEAIALAEGAQPHRIAGRCSVFCKSDCTHALNKGESRASVAAGLCHMMAEKIAELIKDRDVEHVALVGGGSLNNAVVELLRGRFRRLDVPEHAAVFEALGAALWAAHHRTMPLPRDRRQVVARRRSPFGHHRPLNDARELVEFRDARTGVARPGDECLVGLDVGSTTTKAVVMRREDRAVLCSTYLRTNGDPVAAARACYRDLVRDLGGTEVRIVGLGVTGSGRQLAALHARTDTVINEIIAHATAAAHFDPAVDTIFEIGGQDAKYTYLTAGVPSDYAMNEACSAGTGSFLEESAREALGVATEKIADLAVLGEAPPDFSDQCAAFISSDIKIAGQEGIEKENVLAGLVYSICMNYVNRVKGPRPVGKRIFMQGGVCYNKAVPLAMASLMQTKIVVPPEPGLMGAIGVALETAQRLETEALETRAFDLGELAQREAVREKTFICAGGREKCDRKCEVALIRVDDEVLPFGGACNRYYNLRCKRHDDAAELDLVARRQRALFETFGVDPRPAQEGGAAGKQTVGFLRSFLTHSLYPLFSRFFDRLGFQVTLAEGIDKEGIARIESAFCLPAEISHGSFFGLLKQSPDYIFLPHVMQIPVANVPTFSRTCPFVQGEPYYLRTTFRHELESSKTVFLSPVLRMQHGYSQARQSMVDVARSMGASEAEAQQAWDAAEAAQAAFDRWLLEEGQRALTRLASEPERFGIVLLGRPYNTFASEANMGIPHKIASRGYLTIPYDMLPAAQYGVHDNMFWALGQKLMKAAGFVKDHENLFGFYVSNFSCGPDSFLLGFFRTLMGRKPSLTLELDQHTADAGIDTRIEAALDIMTSHRRNPGTAAVLPDFVPARMERHPQLPVVASDGRRLGLRHKDVEVLLPSMGRHATEAVAAVLRGVGLNTVALPMPDKDVLLLGRKNTTCKECLPYIVTTGSFLSHIKKRESTEKVSLCFMPTGGGPCRLGQYGAALRELIHRERMENVAVLGLTNEDGYGGLGGRTLLRGWQAIVVSDVIGDIRSVLNVAAEDRASAERVLEEGWQELVEWFEGKSAESLPRALRRFADKLARIPLRMRPSDVPVVSMVGEIYVRREEFSRKNIVGYLEDHGFAVRVAPVAEYLHYSNYVVNSGLGERRFSWRDRIKMRLLAKIENWTEAQIKRGLAHSGLYKAEMTEIEKTIGSARHLISEHYRGETILTVGLALREILHDTCGVISIGPFGCMPSRVAESILRREMRPEGKARVPGWQDKVAPFADLDVLPFMALETDGNPYPQIVEAGLDAFVLQARRLHERMRSLDRQRAEGLSLRRLLAYCAGLLGAKETASPA